MTEQQFQTINVFLHNGLLKYKRKYEDKFIKILFPELLLGKFKKELSSIVTNIEFKNDFYYNGCRIIPYEETCILIKDVIEIHVNGIKNGFPIFEPVITLDLKGIGL